MNTAAAMRGEVDDTFRSALGSSSFSNSDTSCNSVSSSSFGCGNSGTSSGSARFSGGGNSAVNGSSIDDVDARGKARDRVETRRVPSRGKTKDIRTKHASDYNRGNGDAPRQVERSSDVDKEGALNGRRSTRAKGHTATKGTSDFAGHREAEHGTSRPRALGSGSDANNFSSVVAQRLIEHGRRHYGGGLDRGGECLSSINTESRRATTNSVGSINAVAERELVVQGGRPSGTSSRKELVWAAGVRGRSSYSTGSRSGSSSMYGSGSSYDVLDYNRDEANGADAGPCHDFDELVRVVSRFQQSPTLSPGLTTASADPPTEKRKNASKDTDTYPFLLGNRGGGGGTELGSSGAKTVEASSRQSVPSRAGGGRQAATAASNGICQDDHVSSSPPSSVRLLRHSEFLALAPRTAQTPSLSPELPSRLPAIRPLARRPSDLSKRVPSTPRGSSILPADDEMVATVADRYPPRDRSTFTASGRVALPTRFAPELDSASESVAALSPSDGQADVVADARPPESQPVEEKATHTSPAGLENARPLREEAATWPGVWDTGGESGVPSEAGTITRGGDSRGSMKAAIPRKAKRGPKTSTSAASTASNRRNALKAVTPATMAKMSPARPPRAGAPRMEATASHGVWGIPTDRTESETSSTSVSEAAILEEMEAAMAEVQLEVKPEETPEPAKAQRKALKGRRKGKRRAFFASVSSGSIKVNGNATEAGKGAADESTSRGVDTNGADGENVNGCAVGKESRRGKGQEGMVSGNGAAVEGETEDGEGASTIDKERGIGGDRGREKAAVSTDEVQTASHHHERERDSGVEAIVVEDSMSTCGRALYEYATREGVANRPNMSPLKIYLRHRRAKYNPVW